jgi:catechol 2,3-dioxygenase-like lactoylglutathione lyase family enzyme
MIRRLHHVKIMVPVGAESEARAFYCDLLGLREVPKPPELLGCGVFWFGLENVLVYVGTEDGVDCGVTKARLGYGVDDLGFWRTRLKAAGVPISASLPIAGHERFEVRDPFGNRIEIQQI